MISRPRFATRGGRRGPWPLSAFCAVIVVLACLSGARPAHAQSFDIVARAAFLMDARTGQVLYEKNADEPLPPASLTKIMTMLVVMDAVKAGTVSLDDPVRTSRRASQTGGSQVYLAEGETHPLRQMLKAIAIASANDASVAVAEFLAGSEEAFTQLMNERARQLGMTRSVFYNADGLPPGPGEPPSLTSARDIARAAQALVLEHPEVLEWTSTPMERFRENPLFILYNTNRLVSTYEGLDGLKTGHTEAAGWCLVATAQRGETRLISVVMGTESQNAREERTRALLDYGFNRFAPTVAAEGVVGTLRIRGGNPERIDAVLPAPARVLVPRVAGAGVAGRLEAQEGVAAPLAAGTKVGEYVVSLGDQELARFPVVAARDVERANVLVRIWRAVRDFVLGLLPWGRS